VIDTKVIGIYLGVLGGLLASGLGLPVPEELWIVGAGASAGHQESGVFWWVMLPTCIVGVVVGDGLLYGIGRIWGHKLLDKKWVQKWLVSPDKRVRIQRNFDRYGIWILLGARLVPGIRSPIFLMAGMNHMPLVKFIIADGLYAIPGVSIMFFLAYNFTDSFVELVKKADSYRQVIVVFIAGVAVGYLIRFIQVHPVTEGDPKEVPIIGEQIASHVGEPKAGEKKEEVTANPVN
jgi:membrane protein DedA with SNARE-associated domain